MATKKFDLVGSIMDYESGQLGDKATLKLFTHLLNTGQAWSLQGHYGRTAQALLDEQWIIKRGKRYLINQDKVAAHGLE